MQVLLSERDGVELLGDVPSGVEVALWDCTGEPPSGVDRSEFWVPPFAHGAKQAAGLAALPALKVIQLLSAGADAWVDVVPEGVRLCDARGAHTSSTSEWAATAVLASIREFGSFTQSQLAGRWDQRATEGVAGKRVVVVGAGDIGEALCARLAPFEVDLVRVARSARENVHAIDELPALLPSADVVVLLVPLTAATTGLVDAQFLAAMPDGALLVNAARGPVVDTDALLSELTSRRLHAALDVTDPEPLPAGHPLWSAPNLLLTPHVGGNVTGLARRAYAIAAAQLARYAAGEELHNVVTNGY